MIYPLIIYQFSIGVIHMVKRIILAVSVLVLIIITSLYLFNRKPNVNKIIDQTIAEQTEINENSDEEVNTEAESKDNETDGSTNPTDQPKTNQFKEMITDTVKSAVDFFKSDIYITAIGDSLTQGVGDPTKQGGYIGILDRTINHSKQVVEFNNLGKSGNRSDQLLKRLESPEVINAIAQSNAVLITIGANDVMLVVKENITNLVYSKFVKEREKFEIRLNDILETIVGINADTDIYILGFYNPFEKYFPEVKELDDIVNDWNETGEIVTSRYENATFIPIKDLFDDADEELFADDHFHPNLNGYRLMADRVLDYLTEEKE